MVAYNLMLAVFPFALLVLFIFGQVVNSDDVEQSVIVESSGSSRTGEGTLQEAIDRVRASSTTIGIAAVVGGIWIGASFWGAMDTASAGSTTSSAAAGCSRSAGRWSCAGTPPPARGQRDRADSRERRADERRQVAVRPGQAGAQSGRRSS